MAFGARESNWIVGLCRNWPSTSPPPSTRFLLRQKRPLKPRSLPASVRRRKSLPAGTSPSPRLSRRADCLAFPPAPGWPLRTIPALPNAASHATRTSAPVRKASLLSLEHPAGKTLESSHWKRRPRALFRSPSGSGRAWATDSYRFDRESPEAACQNYSFRRRPKLEVRLAYPLVGKLLSQVAGQLPHHGHRIVLLAMW